MVNASRGASGSVASIHKLHPMMGSGMVARRSMLHMSRALFLPDAEDQCVMNLQKEGVGEARVLLS